MKNTFARRLHFVALILAATACARTAGSGPAPNGPVDPGTGVVQAAGGDVPFYPGDISLQSVPSMPRVPKRDPSRHIALWTEELIGRQGAHLFARNDTDVPVRIAKVSIYECINIEGGCVDYDPNLVLKPGEKRRLYTVVPHQNSKPYHFQWRASGGEERIATSPRNNPATGNSRMTPGSGSASTPSRVNTTATPPAIVSTATGNSLDAVGATIHMSYPMPGTRSLESETPALKFRSRRMRLSGDVDAHDVFGGATLWIKASGPDGDVTAESSEDTRATGTGKSHLAVTLLIPANATKVTLGVKLNGTGDITVTAFKFQPATAAPVRREQE